MKKRSERIVQLATEIGAVRERLRQMEAELDSLLPEDNDSLARGAVVSSGNGMHPGSMASRVVELLAGSEHAFDAPTIAQQLGIKNVNSLRGTLRRLVDSKKIDKRGRGKFRAHREAGMSP